MIKKVILSILIVFSLSEYVNGQCIPPNISASFSNIGNCTFKLIGNSTIFGPQFAWNGPSIPANSPNPFIATTAGVYTLTVTNPTTGCTSNATVNITPCALPIQILSFDATCDKDRVNLKWVTASQINNDYFTIERTTNGINYEILGTILGAGNSNKILNYSFVDTKPLEGIAYYSLKQTDYNGEAKYLKLVAINCNDVEDLTISPNPGTGKFIFAGSKQESNVIVIDMLGQIVFQTKIFSNKTEIDLSNLINGIYFIWSNSKTESRSVKLIIDR